MEFATYDGLTRVYQPQTRDEFFEELTRSIQRSIDAGALSEKPVARSTFPKRGKKTVERFQLDQV